uniref:Uncharacterized protein n=1 Tax=Cairina moschata TaxID=8855 RepID=A0A8C3CP02_CAIMO
PGHSQCIADSTRGCAPQFHDPSTMNCPVPFSEQPVLPSGNYHSLGGAVFVMPMIRNTRGGRRRHSTALLQSTPLQTEEPPTGFGKEEHSQEGGKRQGFGLGCRYH